MKAINQDCSASGIPLWLSGYGAWLGEQQVGRPRGIETSGCFWCGARRSQETCHNALTGPEADQCYRHRPGSGQVKAGYAMLYHRGNDLPVCIIVTLVLQLRWPPISRPCGGSSRQMSTDSLAKRRMLLFMTYTPKTMRGLVNFTIYSSYNPHFPFLVI